MELYGNFLQTKFKYFSRLPHICEQTPAFTVAWRSEESDPMRCLPHKTADNKSGLSKSFKVAGWWWINSKQLWNLHQRHTFFRAEASWDILKFGVSTADTMLFRQNTCDFKHTVEMSQASHDVVRLERFTVLNLFKYAFNVIQNWKTDALQILFDAAYFLLAVMVDGDESSRLRMAN